MSLITTYAELQTEAASILHRDDLTEEIKRSIALCEAELQAKCKLLEFETTGNVTITSGSGTLPSGLVGIRGVYWNASTINELEYVNTDAFNAMRNNTGTPEFYTVTGSTLSVSPSDTGTAVVTYMAKFTALSNSNTSNAILSNFPDAYLYGALKHVCVHTMDDSGLQRYGILFNAACDRINLNNEQRRYGHSLAVRAR